MQPAIPWVFSPAEHPAGAGGEAECLRKIFQAVRAHTHAHRRTRLQHGVKFDGVLENGIDIWGNGFLQGRDLLRQPNPFRNQAWCAADFLFIC